MIAQHISNGMYGMILVEPEGGLAPVEREFYVMQGELYTAERHGTRGHQEFSIDKLLDERPEHFMFNGTMGALTKIHRMEAKVGETVHLDYPGRYILVDHALSRMEKGLVGFLHVDGEADPAVFVADEEPDPNSGH